MIRLKKTMANAQCTLANSDRILACANEIDETISGPLFRTSLPSCLEAIYSFPANFFGTGACLLVAPLWIAVLALDADDNCIGGEGSSEEQTHFKTTLLKLGTISLTGFFVAVWAAFQKGYNSAFGRLYDAKLYNLASPFCVLFLSYTLGLFPAGSSCSKSEKIFSKAIYSLFLWFPVMQIVTSLKQWAKRQRPAYKDSKRKGNWVKNKKFPAVSHILAKYNGDASFPSGDAAAAAVFAIPVADLEYIIVAWVMVLLACTGRMYILAHHFSDVFIGASISYCIHRFMTAIGLGVNDMQWWYPLIVSAAFIFYYKFTTKKKR